MVDEKDIWKSLSEKAGLPRHVLVDNGSEFKANPLADVIASPGLEKDASDKRPLGD